jgi:hypothetical protein
MCGALNEDKSRLGYSLRDEGSIGGRCRRIFGARNHESWGCNLAELG